MTRATNGSPCRSSGSSLIPAAARITVEQANGRAYGASAYARLLKALAESAAGMALLGLMEDL